MNALFEQVFNLLTAQSTLDDTSDAAMWRGFLGSLDDATLNACGAVALVSVTDFMAKHLQAHQAYPATLSPDAVAAVLCRFQTYPVVTDAAIRLSAECQRLAAQAPAHQSPSAESLASGKSALSVPVAAPVDAQLSHS